MRSGSFFSAGLPKGGHLDRTPDSTSLQSFATFGELLRYLRRRERLTQLELSIAVGYSEAQISRLEQNQRLPDLAALKALFIPALYIEHEPEIIARFLELAQSARQEDAPAPGTPPYKGLLFFNETDAELFFGRETLTQRLADHVMALAQGASTRLLAVVGASGSGKSSLVRAGLAVALRQAGWEVRIFTPGACPRAALETQTERGGSRRRSHRTLVLVDQFEETFTLCRDESERVSFINKLLDLAQESSTKVAVVIALRADFYAYCAQYPALRDAVAAEQVYIGGMAIEELRRAIVEPARRGGWEFEPGLVEVVLQDLAEHGSHEPEPGALPLLSHALLATWERRRGRTLTLEGYRASGGVRGAIAETAESVFSDQLDQAQQEIAREVFLRLTELGEGTQDTRRRAALSELMRQSDEATQLRAVLNTLAEARLVTLNEDSAEVAHEALIREWQRLHEWLVQDREGLLLHRHLTESAYDWEARGRDPAELYRGGRLAQAREWAAANNERRLNAAERAFLEASIEQEQREAVEREAQRQRELEAAQKLAETQSRAARQLRRRAIYLAAALALTILAALIAGFFANRNLALAVQNAESASLANTQQALAESEAQARATAEAKALHERDLAQAQRLAAEANSLLDGDANLFALLTIRSLNLQYTPSGDANLISLTALEAPPQEFKGHREDVWGVTFSPDGRYLATGSFDQTARLWDVASGEELRRFDGHTGAVGQVAFSPDGKLLVTAGEGDFTARLWDVETGQELRRFAGHTAGVAYAVFAPDGKTIATSGGDSTARIWDVATGQELLSLPQSNPASGLAFSPDGTRLLTGSEDRFARLWDTGTGIELRVLVHPDNASAVAYSRDGQTVATGSANGTIRLWDAASGQMLAEFTGHQGLVWGIQFSPDNRTLLSGSEDQTARLWDLASGQTLRIFGSHGDTVYAVAFSPDGSQIATASHDRLVRIWNLRTYPGGTRFSGHSGVVWQASFSPDGRRVITASEDGSVRIWDASSGQTLITLDGHGDQVRGAVFSSDGRLALTAGADNTARLWDAASGEELRRFEGHTDIINRAAFSPDGKYIVTASFDGTAQVWDAQTAQVVATYTGQGPGHVNRIAFSPDGKTVATSGDDGTARTWDLLSGEERMVFQGHTDFVTGVAFSPDGKTLLTASWDGTARLWEAASGKELHRFAGHLGGASGAAFLPDGRFVLTSGFDGTARLWDVQTGAEVRRFTGHTSVVRDVTFSPDGRYFLTASEDNTARLWLTDLHDTIRAVCALLTRDLTPEERVQFGISDPGPTCPAP